MSVMQQTHIYTYEHAHTWSSIACSFLTHLVIGDFVEDLVDLRGIADRHLDGVGVGKAVQVERPLQGLEHKLVLLAGGSDNNKPV